MTYYMLVVDPCVRPHPIETEGLTWEEARTQMINTYAAYLKSWKTMTEEQYLASDIITHLENKEIQG